MVKKDQAKKLTPLMLATALASVSSNAIAYDHAKQSSTFDSEQDFINSQNATFTQTTNPKTGMIYSDGD